MPEDILRIAHREARDGREELLGTALLFAEHVHQARVGAVPPAVPLLPQCSDVLFAFLEAPLEDRTRAPARGRQPAEIDLARTLGDVLLDLRLPIHRSDVSELEVVRGLPPVRLGCEPQLADLAGEARQLVG